jgi:hypothetical protein
VTQPRRAAGRCRVGRGVGEQVQLLTQAQQWQQVGGAVGVGLHQLVTAAQGRGEERRRMEGEQIERQPGRQELGRVLSDACQLLIEKIAEQQSVALERFIQGFGERRRVPIGGRSHLPQLAQEDLQRRRDR